MAFGKGGGGERRDRRPSSGGFGTPKMQGVSLSFLYESILI